MLIDKSIQDSLDFHSQKALNIHCSIEVIVHASTRLDFVDIVKHFYSKDEGVRSVKRCIKPYLSDAIENMWVRGELDFERSYLRMVVDKETSSTAFEVLDGTCMEQLRTLTPDTCFEIYDDVAPWKAACDALCLASKSLRYGVRVALTAGVLEDAQNEQMWDLLLQMPLHEQNGSNAPKCKWMKRKLKVSRAKAGRTPPPSPSLRLSLEGQCLSVTQAGG